MNEKRARGEGRVYLRGAIWWIQYYDRGRQIRESSCTDNEEKARKILRKKIGAVENGIQQDTRGLRFEDLRESYFDDYRTNGRKSLRTDKSGAPYLDKVTRLDEFFTGFRASEIVTDDVRKFIANQQAKGLSNGSINRSVAALKRMFNLAKRDGKLRNVPYFPMLKEASPRQGFFEPDEYQKMLTELPQYLRLPFSIGYFTVMREGEILGLHWAQVDFLRNVIQLKAGETKNDDARQVPIVPQLRTLLLEQLATRKPDCPHVCYRPDRRGLPVKIRGFRKAWYSASIRSGLGRMISKTDAVTGELIYAKPRGVRSKPKVKMVYQGKVFHDLRRTGARNLIFAGVPERVVMAIGGWKTRSVMDRYTIVSPRDVAEAGRKLAAFHENGHKTGTISESDVPVEHVIN
jgi:integrase